MEYFATLPEYKPRPLSSYGLLPMDFSPDSALKTAKIKPRTGQKGGKPSKPSRFIPGDIHHRGYHCDDSGRILPIWKNPLDPFAIDPESLHYRPVLPDYPTAPPPKQRAKSPDCPHVWESHETIDQLYKILATAGFRLDLNAIRNDQLGNRNQARRQQGPGPHGHLREQVQARKNLMQNAVPRRGDSAAAREWEQRLNMDVAGAQANAEDFTKEFMTNMYEASNTSSSMVTRQEHLVVEQHQYEQPQQDEVEQPLQVDQSPPPALPPKTKIMFSPSRDVFSPTQRESPKEFIPVKEKAKMIEQQQEEIDSRMQRVASEEATETFAEESTKMVSGEALKGGVRILPPSPVTVVKETTVTERSGSAGGASIEHRTITTTTTTSSSSMEGSARVDHEVPSHIPVLEDKYHVTENLDELGENQSVTSEVSSIHQQQSRTTVSSSQVMMTSSSLSSQQNQHFDPYSMQQQQQQPVRGQNQSSYCYVVSSTSETPSGGIQQMRTTTTTYSSGQRFDSRTKEELEFEALMREQEAEDEMLQRRQNQSYVVTSPPASGSPAPYQLHLRHPNQSPVTVEEERPKYRTPPSTPFQPAFYKTPPMDPRDRVKHPDFKLPSQRAKTSTEKWIRSEEEVQYDGDTEF